MILPVILAGGSGERLWPLSRELYPKQFLRLCSSNTMLQDCLARLPKNDLCLHALIVCNEEHRFIAAEQLRQKNIRISGIILEPLAKNTALAISVAALWAQNKYKDLTLLILPADHMIEETNKFHEAIDNGFLLSQKEYLVAFGIVPTCAETGYGYITKGSSIENTQSYKIKSFIEKPNKDLAQELISTKTTLWNSGMFMFQCSTLIKELSKYQPETLTAAQKSINNFSQDSDFIRLEKKSYLKAKSISIDHAIMEHTQQAAVIPLNIKWSDIGSWNALWKQSNKDQNNNLLLGDTIAIDTKNCLIDARGTTVATIGLNDLIIATTKNAILIADQNKAQKVKDIVQILKSKNSVLTTEPCRVSRPWGWFESIVKEDGFQVKRLFIDHNKSISLQLHHHRSEHWIVVKGTARITCGTEQFLLSENQSTYIPIGTKHRLENVGKISLEIIEIQCGRYLGEDDIVRFHDEYGRVPIKEKEHE